MRSPIFRYSKLERIFYSLWKKPASSKLTFLSSKNSKHHFLPTSLYYPNIWIQHLKGSGTTNHPWKHLLHVQLSLVPTQRLLSEAWKTLSTWLSSGTKSKDNWLTASLWGPPLLEEWRNSTQKLIYICYWSCLLHLYWRYILVSFYFLAILKNSLAEIFESGRHCNQFGPWTPGGGGGLGKEEFWAWSTLQLT